MEGGGTHTHTHMQAAVALRSRGWSSKHEQHVVWAVAAGRGDELTEVV